MFAVELYGSPFYKSSKWLRDAGNALVIGSKGDRTKFATREECEQYVGKNWVNGFKARIVEI